MCIRDRFKGGLEDSIDLDTDKHAYDLYLYNKEQIKTLEAYNKQFEQEIKLQMGDHDFGENNFMQVSYKPVTSVRIDSKRLKKERPDLYKEYTRQSESRRFYVKEIKE